MTDKVLRLNIKAISDFSDVQSNVQNLQQYLNKLKLPTNLKSNFASMFGDLEKEMAKYQKMLDSGFKTKGDITSFDKTGERIGNMISRIGKEMGEISPDVLGRAFADINLEALRKAENELKELQDGLKNAVSAASGFKNVEQDISKIFENLGKSKEVDEIKKKFTEAFATGDVKKMEAAVAQLKNRTDKLAENGALWNATKEAATKLQSIVTAIGNDDSVQKFSAKVADAKVNVKTLSEQNLNQLIQVFRDGAVATEQMGEGSKKVHRALVDTKAASQGLGSELDSLKHRITYFFGLTNSVMLFRRAVTKAFNTVKELDAVMTEMAVVTDLEVGDYWKRLPEFSKNAKELGVSIKGAYEATTLYLQQGLEMNKAQEVANETLKMARIAGMEAADATNMMTAALRGFNMEINENSAQRINDVYSELAAITASNTEEIATAMTKTASIASSANMEFETTSALLAQIIETTREAPETAGTALKTVIARFQELKKAPSEIGEIEGEIVDANKIETALRTIGVALRDTNGQFRDLDDVFLEISSKWDTLDLNTQRYIATIAAGSRQQSRFIAMMSDYDRTIELVNAANNSAGASQKQYEKTLDSLETKLNQLSVAWQTFLMGLADNTAIKFFISSLTKILEGINGILNGLSGDKGLIKSILSLGMVFGGLKLGRNVFNKLFASIGSAFLGKGTEVGKSFLSGLTNTATKGAAKVKNIFRKDFWISSIPKINIDGFEKDVRLIQLSQEKLGSLQNAQVKDQIAIEAALLNTKSAYERLGITGLQYADIQEGLVSSDKLAVIMSNDKTRAALLEASAKGKVEKETYDQFYAEALLNNQRKMGLLTQIKVYSSLLFGIGMKNKDTAATLGLTTAEIGKTAATEGATTAQWLYNAALAGCPIGWVLAGIAAIAGIMWLTARNTETAAEKTARLNEEAETASEVAEEAKNSYEELLTSFDEYDSAQKTLEELTRGTEEWKDALIEANNQVLELLKTYPSLSEYISTGSEGQLTILPEGKNVLLTGQKEKVQATQRAAIGSQMSLVLNELENSNADFIYFLQRENELGESEFDQEAFNNLLELYKNNPKAFTGKDTSLIEQALGVTLGETITQTALEAIKTGMPQYVADKQAAEKKLAGNMSAMLSTSANDALIQSEHSGQIQDIFSNLFSVEEYDTAIEEAASEYSGTKNKLKGLYQGTFNLTDEEVEKALEGKNNKEAKAFMKDMLAQNDVLKAVSDGMNNFYSDFAKLSKEEQDKALKLMKKDGKGFTKGLSDVYKNFTLEKGSDGSVDLIEISKRFEKDTGLALEAVATQMNMSAEELAQMLIDNAQKTEEAYTEATKLLSGKGIELNLDKLSVEEAEELTNHLYQVMLSSGIDGAKEMTNSINAILGKISDPTEAEQFAAVLNSIDWSKESSVQSFSDSIKELGIAGELSEIEIDNLEKQIINLADATNELNFEQVKNEISALDEIADDIAGKGSDEPLYFTDAQRETLINNGIAEEGFALTGIDEWIYIGDSTEGLLKSINNRVGDILGEVSTERRREDINKGEKWEELKGISGVALNTRGPLGQYGYYELAEAIGRGAITIQDADPLRTIVSALGADINADGEKFSIENFNYKDLTELIKNHYKTYYGENGAILESNRNTLSAEQYMIDSLKYSNMSASEIAALGAAVGKDREFQISALVAKAKAAGVSQTDIDAFKNKAAKSTALTDVVKYSIANLIEEELTTSRLKETASKINDIFGNYEDPNKIGDRDAKKIADILGISSDYVKENSELISKAMQGDFSSYTTLATDLKRKFASNSSTREALIQAGLLVPETKVVSGKTNTTLDGKILFGGTTITTDLFKLTTELLAEATGNYEGTLEEDRVEPVENTFDKQYNLISQINEEMRTREKIQQKYNKLIEDNNVSVAELYTLSKEEIASLQRQLSLQDKLLTARKSELSNYLTNAGFKVKKETEKDGTVIKKYLTSDETDTGIYYKDSVLQVDQEILDKLAETNPKLYEEVEDIVKELGDLQNEITDVEKDISGILSDVEKIRKRGKEEYENLESRIFNALIERDNQLIEEQEKINDSINEASSDMINAIQTNINKLRQDRKNEETQNSISEKETRLAYLKQDTSGANELEIRQLEEEIAKEKQDYQDSLIDQAIQDLQTQNDHAAEQRETQIQLQRDQLQADQQNGVYAEKAALILDEALANGGIFSQDSEFYELLFSTEGWLSKPLSEQTQLLKELKNAFEAAALYKSNYLGDDVDYMALMKAQFASNGGVIDDTIWALNKMRNAKIDAMPDSDRWVSSWGYFTTESDLLSHLQGISEDPSSSLKNPAAWNESRKPEDQKNYEGYTPKLNEEMLDQAENYSGDYMAYMVDKYDSRMGITSEIWTYNAARNKKLDAMGKEAKQKYGYFTNPYVLEQYLLEYKTSGMPNMEKFIEKMKNLGITQFKTGGLADFTGPAWLDGTKSRPEMVLNAQDTENFILLKDVLSGLLHLPASNSEATNTNYIDVSVQVDEISNDYDVDQMVDRVKQKIYEDGMYRNNNMINLIR